MRARQLSTTANTVVASLLVAAGALGAAVACSSSTSSGDTTPLTPGAEGGGGNEGSTEASNGAETSITGPAQIGRIIDAVGKTGVSGATVSIAGNSVTTGDDGKYIAAGIPINTPYSMSVTAPDHFKLDEQEWIVKTSVFDRGDTSLLSSSTAMFLSSLLPARDAAKGLLAVRIYPLAPCLSEQGSILSLSPAGTSQLTYFKGGFPNKTATSATKDESFSGIFTDVDPGVPLTVTVSSPDCEQVAFPVDYGGVTLTGQQKAEAGDVVSYIRIFIGPKKIADAGTD
jgi:hypothetical protein